MSDGVTILPAPPYALGLGDAATNIPGTRTSGPRGVESVLEYNGLYLNVREWRDTFLVTSINGFDDADIRDSREANPTGHGETPFSSYYGGRTIVLQGKIRTQTIWKMRDMQQALRAAFSDLSQERPLYIRTGNIDADMMIMCKKTGSIQMQEEQKTANHFERNFQITLRASRPFFTSYKEELVQAGPMAAATLAWEAINKGNFDASPKFRIISTVNAAVNGGIGLTITDDLNNQSLVLKAPPGTTAIIPVGNYMIVDIANRTMKEYVTATDAFVANAFNRLNITSDWPVLAPGKNTLTATRTAGSTVCTIQTRWNHTYT